MTTTFDDDFRDEKGEISGVLISKMDLLPVEDSQFIQYRWKLSGNKLTISEPRSMNKSGITKPSKINQVVSFIIPPSPEVSGNLIILENKIWKFIMKPEIGTVLYEFLPKNPVKRGWFTYGKRQRKRRSKSKKRTKKRKSKSKKRTKKRKSRKY